MIMHRGEITGNLVVRSKNRKKESGRIKGWGDKQKNKRSGKAKEPTKPSAETARKTSLGSHLCRVSAQREALLR